MGLVQSMSRQRNCWDKAPQESLFGHFKDELSRAMELEKAAACKIQTAAPKGCLAFFKMSFTKGTF